MDTIEIRPINLIRDPKLLNQTTVEMLRKQLLRYPYYQSLRLLLLENLYLIHDPQFNEELRRSAPLLADRSVLFHLIEGAHYEIEPQTIEESLNMRDDDRTQSLIDLYLDKLPSEKTSRKISPNEAAQDYASYLIQMDAEEEKAPFELPVTDDEDEVQTNTTPRKTRIILSEKSDEELQTPSNEEPRKEEFYTETLAHIYIKQHKYERALEIIKALSTNNPKKNSYFADQIRFLEKLILINKNNS